MTNCLDLIKADTNIPEKEKEYLSAPMPAPFYFNPKRIKAFVLGADPSNFSNNGKPQFLTTVFGIGQDHRYFSGILKNLNTIGLHLEDVYVQNVVRNYMGEETGKNKYWKLFAEHWLPFLKAELDQADPKKTVPVLVTAEAIIKYLMDDTVKIDKADVVYAGEVLPIQPANNKLGRPLVAFYRHPLYSLKGVDTYSISLKKFLNKE